MLAYVLAFSSALGNHQFGRTAGDDNITVPILDIGKVGKFLSCASGVERPPITACHAEMGGRHIYTRMKLLAPPVVLRRHMRCRVPEPFRKVDRHRHQIGDVPKGGVEDVGLLPSPI